MVINVSTRENVDKALPRTMVNQNVGTGAPSQYKHGFTKYGDIH